MAVGCACVRPALSNGKCVYGICANVYVVVYVFTEYVGVLSYDSDVATGVGVYVVFVLYVSSSADN